MQFLPIFKSKGIFYTALYVEGLQNQDFSCCVNTDGVVVFKSSKFDIWPLLLSINELDYKTRCRNTILVGLWFGKSKPNLDTFLDGFVNQFNDLALHPLTWKHNGTLMTSKVLFPLFAADAVARCAVQGIKQHNGYQSCPWCIAFGRRHDVILSLVITISR